MSDPGHEERRKYNRLETRLELAIRDGTSTRAAELRDLSQGGACILIPGNELPRGDRIEVILPVGDEQVGIGADVVRSTPTNDGALTAVKFSGAGEHELAAVDRLLGELLVATGGGVRTTPRVSRRVMMPIETSEEMAAVVENISLGGLALKVECPLEIGERVMLVLPGPDGEDMLSLQGKVTSQRTYSDDTSSTYIVGLAFDELDKQRAGLLDALLVSLLRHA